MEEIIQFSNLQFLVKQKYGVKYDREKKVWTCSCQSFKYKNSKEYGCKHIKDVLEWLKNNYDSVL